MTKPVTEREQEESLREAAALGNEEKLESLIRNGVVVNAQNTVNGWYNYISLECWLLFMKCPECPDMSIPIRTTSNIIGIQTTSHFGTGVNCPDTLDQCPIDTAVQSPKYLGSEVS